MAASPGPSRGQKRSWPFDGCDEARSQVPQREWQLRSSHEMNWDASSTPKYAPQVNKTFADQTTWSSQSVPTRPSGEQLCAIVEENVNINLTQFGIWEESDTSPMITPVDPGFAAQPEASGGRSRPEDPAPRTVCFGALCDVVIFHLGDDQKTKPAIRLPPTQVDSEPVHLQIIKRDDTYRLLQKEDPQELGILNSRVANALEDLESLKDVTFEAVSEISDFRRVINYLHSKTKTRKPTEWHVEINLYGLQSSKEAVGKILAKSKLSLQNPIWISADMAVENPHMIVFPNLPSGLSLIQIQPSLSTTVLSKHITADRIHEILNDLDQHDLGGLDDNTYGLGIDSRIATRLLYHQRVGVAFQLQREMIELSSSFSLWQKAGLYQSNEVFRHTITGKRTATPQPDGLGGILADEMGLGKTLTMLGTIFTTLDHLKIFRAAKHDRSHANEPSSCPGGTLVIAPAAILLDGWISEMERHIGPGIVQIYKYHGSQKFVEKSKLAKCDIVLTTYHTLAADLARHDGQLHNIHWYRVVLDEAHHIRNANTTLSRAVMALVARSRWCLTGTPIQNKLDDLGTLLQFLRVPCLQTSGELKKQILQKIEAGEDEGFDKLRALLKNLCIRRTKDLIHLPEPTTLQYNLRLSEEERARYIQIGQEHRKAIDDAVCGGKPADAYRTMFQIMLRLRMLCNHGTFEEQVSAPSPEDSVGSLAMLQGGSAMCAYCREDIDADGSGGSCVASQLHPCYHLVCDLCVHQYRGDLETLRAGLHVACPLCRTPLEQSNTLSLLSSGTVRSTATHSVSTKLSKLIEDIREHRHSDKCIVFSSWKKTLTVTSKLLDRHKIPYVQIDGSLSLSARHEALSRFEHYPEIPVLMMTLGTGAVGLNLTIATRIHIIEPQWNPSIEAQAIGRAVRFGQSKNVTIVRYVVQHTVEQYIQEMQARKIQLAELGFEGGNDSSDTEKLEKLKEIRQYLEPPFDDGQVSTVHSR